MAISQNFPSTRPSLNLNFARSRKLDSRITFTRGSTATYVDESGLIRTAGINEARFDYDPITGESLGLLIEESRTNLLQYSQALATSPWGIFNNGGTSITNNTIVAPDGTTTASTFTIGTASDSIYQDVSVLGTGTYTFSVFVKAGTSNQINITGFFVWNTAQNIGNCRFNPITGQIVVGTGRVESYPNGWYKVSVTGTGNNSLNNTFRAQIYGDGLGTVYLWGAQLEAGSFPTSYIPTVASSVTRSTDVASITGTNFSDWYNSNEGSVVSTFKFYANHPPYYEAVSVAGGGGGFMVINDGTGLVTDCYGGGTVVTGGDNARTKFITGVRAYKFSTNDSVIGCSGASSITTQTGTITNPNTTALWLGRRGDGGSTYIMNGHIRNVSYYPVRLPNTQLLTLTK